MYKRIFTGHILASHAEYSNYIEYAIKIINWPWWLYQDTKQGWMDLSAIAKLSLCMKLWGNPEKEATGKCSIYLILYSLIWRTKSCLFHTTGLDKSRAQKRVICIFWIVKIYKDDFMSLALLCWHASKIWPKIWNVFFAKIHNQNQKYTQFCCVVVQYEPFAWTQDSHHRA